MRTRSGNSSYREKAWYGAPTPIDTVVVTRPDPIVVRYGVYTPPDTTDRFLGKYGAPMPIDTVIAKYGVPAVPDPAKTSYAPGPRRDGASDDTHAS